MATTKINFQVDTEVKNQSEAIFSQLGLNLSTALNIFLRQAIRVGGFPFEVRLEQPNSDTVEAIKESEILLQDPAAKRYADVEDALKDLNKWINQYNFSYLQGLAQTTMAILKWLINYLFKKRNIQMQIS